MKRNPEQASGSSEKDAARPFAFGPPVVAAGVADPAAQKYAAGISSRIPNTPKYTTPVAGGNVPPIPLLSTPAVEGKTMAEQAAAARQPRPLFPGAAPSVFPTMPTPPAAKGPALLSSDLLPEEAMKDPEFIPGAGSMLAINQPSLAARYGVIRDKTRIHPQQLSSTSPSKSGGLREETARGLASLMEAQTVSQKAPQEGTEETPEQKTAGPAKEEVKDDRKLNNLDLAGVRDMMMKDILNGDDQKKAVEGRLPPLTLDTLFTHGYITQRVPIIPDVFEPTFRSVSVDEDLALKRLIMAEASSLSVGDQYLLDKLAIMGTVASIEAINGHPMPTHRNADGTFSEDLFWKKFNFLSKYPTHLFSSLGIHSFWFEVRVRKLFSAESVGNG